MPVGPRIRANNVYGILIDNPLTQVATTMNSTGLSILPAVSSAHAVIVLDPKRIFGEPEIVVVTSHVATTTMATITRGQYGTSARAHPMNTPWAHVAVDEDYIAIVTSSTHPSNPYEGQFIYETDTDNALVYDGVSWVPFGGSGTTIFQQTSEPAATLDNLWLDTDESAGVGLSSIIGYSESTATQTGISSEVDVTGCSVNISVPAGRRVRITGRINAAGASDNEVGMFLLIKEGVTELGRVTGQQAMTGAEFTIEGSTIISPSAGSHTYKLTIQTTGGTITTASLASAPNFILVEDITGTLWPAGQSVGAGQIASEAWTTYVPSHTGITIGDGTQTAAYMKLGRTVHVRWTFILGGTSVIGADPRIGLPFAANVATGLRHVGSLNLLDTGVRNWCGISLIHESDSTHAFMTHTESGNAGTVNATNPFTFGSTDAIVMSMTYEAAS